MVPESLPRISRRTMLDSAAVGFGSLALASLVNGESRATDVINSLAVTVPHIAPRAKRIIFLFMSGSVSFIDIFDQ